MIHDFDREAGRYRRKVAGPGHAEFLPATRTRQRYVRVADQNEEHGHIRARPLNNFATSQFNSGLTKPGAGDIDDPGERHHGIGGGRIVFVENQYGMQHLVANVFDAMCNRITAIAVIVVDITDGRTWCRQLPPLFTAALQPDRGETDRND